MAEIPIHKYKYIDGCDGDSGEKYENARGIYGIVLEDLEKLTFWRRTISYF